MNATKKYWINKAINYMENNGIKITDISTEYYRLELMRIYNRAWEEEHKEERQQYFKKYYAEHPYARAVEDIKREKTEKIIELRRKLN